MARVLIVDDSLFQRANLRIMVKQAGYDTLEAANGQEALRIIGVDPPDCLIIDLIMPDIDGLELLDALRKQGLKIPVIVVTADIQESVREECLAMGAAAVLHKPPRKDELKNALQQAIG